MNDEYLWDKSGDPDPEIQKLEEILGTLRYQPKPFEIPPEVLMRRRRSYVPLFAIAASLLIAFLAGGIWLRTRTSQTPVNNRDQVAVVPAPSVLPIEPKVSVTPEVVKNEEQPIKIKQRRPRSRSVPAMSAQDRQEALAAKAQLMLALRLASEKLSEVQRKTQTPMPSNQIKNQHKVG